MSARTAKIEVYRSERRQWKFNTPEIESVREFRWRLRASNGRIIAQSSEGYRRIRDLGRSLELTWPDGAITWSRWAADDGGYEFHPNRYVTWPIVVPEGVVLKVGAK